MEQLSFQYPSWYIVLCVLLGLAFAIGLYFRDKTFREQSNRLNWILGALRFLLATFLSFLLLSPFIKSFQTETQKPIIVIAQDGSESIKSVLGDEKSTALFDNLSTLSEQLEEDFEVVPLTFGERVREGLDNKFEDKITNTSDLIKHVNDFYGTENLGAIVLATDGIFNEGSNPLYINTNFSAPVFTIAVGDTTQRKDLILKRTFLNRIAYLNDQFVVQVDVAATNAKGVNTNLSIFRVNGEGTQKIQEKLISVDSDDFFKTEEIILDADKSGVQRYRIVLGGIQGEATRANNSKDVFIDILDARQKILLLANAPHPDLTALKQSITENQNYQLEVAFADDFQGGGLEKYDFVILHQLPSQRYKVAPVLNNLEQKKIPHFFILGAKSDLAAFNNAQSLLNIRGDGRNFDVINGQVAPGFSLFTLSETISNNIGNFAPMITPFGDYQVDGGAQVLLRQKIGKIETDKPLLLFGEDNNSKIGILTGEGIWKWRLFDFLQNETHDIIDELIGKTVQYVSVKEDKRRFRVNPEKNVFRENENILINAELYNSSYELVNEPDVDITITDNQNKDFSYIFDKTTKAYMLDAGILPVGNYRFTSSVTFNGEQLNASGQFSVQPIQLELFETTANHGMLRLLSDKYGGQFLTYENMNTLGDIIDDSETIKPIIYQTARTRSLINLKWIFFLLLTLLALEWGLRRYYGGY